MIDSINRQKKFKNYQSLKNEVFHIAQTLEKIGYLENELKKIEKINDSIYLADYYVGPKYNYIKIFYSPDDFSKKELLRYSDRITESHFIVSFKKLEATLYGLNQDKTKNGNTFARVSLKNIKSIDSNILTAEICLTNGSKRTIDQIIIKGYDKFPKSFIKYYAGIKKGMNLNNSVLTEKNNALNSLGFVNSKKPPEILFKKDSTTVYLYLTKQ